MVKVIVRLSPVNFDPRIGTDEGSQRVHQLVYSHLLTVDDKLQVVPGLDALAARLDNPDPLTYIVRLRSGVKFHDGHELTSKDVVYTFGSFLDPDFVSAKKAAYQMLESVEALDKYTVQFKLKEPFGSFPSQLVLHVVPDGAGDSLRTFPIGTGPYRFVRYVPDEQVELTAYEGYWDGLPQNAGVVLRIIPDETMRGLELRKGTADLTVNDVSPDIAYQLQKRQPEDPQAPGRGLRLHRPEPARPGPEGQARAAGDRLRRGPRGDRGLPAQGARAAGGRRAVAGGVGVRA